MRECIELACNTGEGDLVYLLDDRCFLVKCYTTCNLVKAPHAESAAARLNWTGTAGLPTRLGLLKLLVFSYLVSPRFLNTGAVLLKRRVKFAGVNYEDK